MSLRAKTLPIGSYIEAQKKESIGMPWSEVHSRGHTIANDNDSKKTTGKST